MSGQPAIGGRRRVALALLVTALLVTAVLTRWAPLGTAPALAQPAEGSPSPSSPGAAADQPTIPDPRLSPELASVAVDSPAYRQALARYRQTESRLADDRARFAGAEAQLADLARADAALVGELNEAARRKAKSERRRDELRRSVVTVAVAGYVHGGFGAGVGSGLDLQQLEDHRQARVLADTATAVQLSELAAHTETVRRMDAVIAADLPALADVRRRVDETTGERDAAQQDGQAASAELFRRTAELADARLEAQVVGLDFSLVVLDAYVKAAVAAFFERPGCGLRWQALAGIGRTESGHGSYGGRHVAANGDVSQPIYGIPLDGTAGTEAIADTDGGALDGDPTVDRAVGPMQFIPSSWRTFGRDGNGDGRADPQNVYDAARAAGLLLCRAGPLDSDAGLRRAFLRYNNSNAYAALVLDRTHGYDAFVLPPAPPA